MEQINLNVKGKKAISADSMILFMHSSDIKSLKLFFASLEH